MKIKLLTTALLLCTGLSAEQTRTISIDTRYFGTQTNNHGFAEFGKEIIGLHNLLFDKVSNKFVSTERGRMLMLVSDFIVASAIGEAFSTVYHEYGHASRLKAAGLNTRYRKRPSNFFSFFTRKLGSPYAGEATTYNLGNTKFKPKKSDRYFNGIQFNNDWKIAVSGAGLNNEMRFAGDVSDKIIEGKGETPDAFFYLIGKTSTLTYGSDTESDGNDLKNMRASYQNKGYKINRGDMDRGNILSFVLSASTYMYGASIYDYTKTGRTHVRAPEFYGIQLPDVESYYTSKGISYKVKSGYRWKDWRFPVSYEFIGKGGSQQEFKFGIVKSLPHYQDITIRADLLMGKALGFSAQAVYAIARNFDVSAGFTHENVKSFEGERNIMSLKNGLKHNQIWGRLSYKF